MISGGWSFLVAARSKTIVWNGPMGVFEMKVAILTVGVDFVSGDTGIS